MSIQPINQNIGKYRDSITDFANLKNFKTLLIALENGKYVPNGFSEIKDRLNKLIFKLRNEYDFTNFFEVRDGYKILQFSDFIDEFWKLLHDVKLEELWLVDSNLILPHELRDTQSNNVVDEDALTTQLPAERSAILEDLGYQLALAAERVSDITTDYLYEPSKEIGCAIIPWAGFIKDYLKGKDLLTHLKELSNYISTFYKDKDIFEKIDISKKNKCDLVEIFFTILIIKVSKNHEIEIPIGISNITEIIEWFRESYWLTLLQCDKNKIEKIFDYYSKSHSFAR